MADLAEDFIHVLSTDAHMTIDEAAPMRDNFDKVVVKFIERDLTVVVFVHQSEAEHVLFVFRAITKHIHNRGECLNVDVAIFIVVEDFENSVGQVSLLLLA